MRPSYNCIFHTEIACTQGWKHDGPLRYWMLTFHHLHMQDHLVLGVSLILIVKKNLLALSRAKSHLALAEHCLLHRIPFNFTRQQAIKPSQKPTNPYKGQKAPSFVDDELWGHQSKYGLMLWWIVLRVPLI